MAAWQTAGEMAEEFIRHGQVARRSKRYEEALTWYKRATVLAPDWGAPWYYMGLAYEELEAWGDALNSFRQAEKRVNSIEEISGSLYLHLGRVLQEHIEPPDLPAALRLYEAALTSDRFIQNWERIGAHFHRGVALRRQGRMQEARQEFWWVVNAQPEHYWGHVLLGVVTWQIDGDLNEAEKSLKQAIVLKPEEKIAYWWLARIYQKEGRLGEAAEAYQQVLAIDPEDEAALQFFREAGR
jgi:tetratricopeptide (TPR) repeat protein